VTSNKTSVISTIRLDVARITRWLMILVLAFAVVAIGMAFPDIDESAVVVYIYAMLGLLASMHVQVSVRDAEA
jgi:hypothetical protein